MAISIRPVTAGSGLASGRLPRGTTWLVLVASLVVSIALFALLSAANRSDFNLVGAIIVG